MIKTETTPAKNGDRMPLRLPIILFFLALQFSLPCPAFPENLKNSDTVLVRINGEAITARDVERFITGFYLGDEGRRMWDQTYDHERLRLRGDILQMMVERRLLAAAAEEEFGDQRRMTAGIEVTVGHIVSDAIEQVGSKVVFLEQLHENGLTLKQWKEFQHKSVLINTYLAARTGELHVRPAEMEEFYRKNKTDFRSGRKIYYQRIYVAPEGRETREDVRDRAERILALIEGGDCFSELARKYCFDYGEDEDGLRIEEVPENYPAGWMPRELQGLEEGEVSGLIEGRGDIYIIAKLVRVVPERHKTFAEVQSRIHSRLLEEKRIAAREKVTDKLREGADIRFTEEGRRLTGNAGALDLP